MCQPATWVTLFRVGASAGRVILDAGGIFLFKSFMVKGLGEMA